MKRQFLIALKRYGGRKESQIFTLKILVSKDENTELRHAERHCPLAGPERITT